MKNAETALPSYNLKDLIILVAEKHPSMRAIIREALHEFGVEHIYTESNPDDGFQTFCDVIPDIAFVDWGPDFDGISLLDKIRRDKKSPNPMAPVIMVTAYTEKAQVYEARDSGMTEFLAQPVSARTIYEHIVTVIESKRAFIRIDDFVGPDRRRRHKEHKGEERRKGADESNGETGAKKST